MRKRHCGTSAGSRLSPDGCRHRLACWHWNASFKRGKRTAQRIQMPGRSMALSGQIARFTGLIFAFDIGGGLQVSRVGASGFDPVRIFDVIFPIEKHRGD